MDSTLPDFDLCGGNLHQKWHQNSFSDLELADSADTWLGCELLLDDPVGEEECSSKLLGQGFDLPPRTITISSENHLNFYADRRPSSPAESADTTTDSLPAGQLDFPASACKLTFLLRAGLPPHLGSRAGNLLRGAAMPLPDYSDVNAVTMAGLALQMARGDANAAMAQLLSWVAAR